MRKAFKILLVSVFAASWLFLLYADIRQAQVIEIQRNYLVDMYRFIQRGCPFSSMQ